MALLVTAGVGFLQAAILFGRKAPLLVSLYANSGVETRLAVYGFLANFGARRFPKGERKALWCARRRIPLAPVGGLTRRLRREWWGCRPEWGSTFFRSERKYQRKHAARRLREKGFDCPFCRRGSQCRAQWSWTAFTNVWSALVLAFFRRQNGRAFFPPLPIAALLCRSWHWADSNGAAWDVSMRIAWLRSTEKRA